MSIRAPFESRSRFRSPYALLEAQAGEYTDYYSGPENPISMDLRVGGDSRVDRDAVRRWVRRHRYALAVALVAFCAMVSGTWRLVPHLTIPDEAAAVRRGLRIGYERDPFIRTFKKGGNLHLYLLAASFVPVAVWWVVSGQLGEIRAAASDLPAELGWDLSPELLRAFYDTMFAGRVLSALFGAGTVFLVYLVARDIESERAGLFGAISLTVAAGYVLTAHYATEDAPMTFFVMVTFLLLVRARQSDGPLLSAAALAFGLATSTKASGGILVLPVAAVIVERYRESLFDPLAFLRRTWRYPALALGAYLAATPSVFLYPRLWLGEVLRYGSNVSGSSVLYNWPDPGWLTQLAHLAIMMGLPLFVLGLCSTAAVVYLLARGRVDGSCWLLVGVAVPYYLVFSLGKMAQPPRMVPLIPILAVFVGIAADRTYRSDHGARPVVIGALALVVVFSAVYTGAALVQFNESRGEATEWTHQRFGAGDEVTVYSQRVYLPEFPANVTVHRYEIYRENPEPNWRPGLDRLDCNEPEYVLLSSNHYNRFFKDPTAFPEVTERYRRLLDEDGYRIVERFGPPVDTDHTALAKFRNSVTLRSHHADGNPTILVLERTAEPAPDCDATASG